MARVSTGQYRIALGKWLTNSEENMTNTSSGSNSTWGAFTPVMPAFIRLIAGVIVLVVIEAVLLGVSWNGQNTLGPIILIAETGLFFIRLVLALIVLPLGKPLSKPVQSV